MTFGAAFVFFEILSYLFPYCGLQVMVSLGAHLLIAIISGVILAQILKFSNKPMFKVLLSTIIIIAMFVLQAQTFTQDSGAPTLKKITNSIKATIYYDKIHENDYLNLNQEEKIVYNSKFNKEFNTEYFHLENLDSGKEYFLTRIDGKLYYDKTKLEIDTSSSPNLIIEIDSNRKRIKHEVSKIENILRVNHGGYERWIIQKFDNELVGYERVLDFLNRRKNYR